VFKLRLGNLKGDLFATVLTFAALAVIRLGSSLILTRLLRPEAYGVMTLLNSIGYVVELLGDIAVTVSVVRHEHGDRPDWLNTAWTLRFGRSLFNTAALFFAAPLLARLYHADELVAPLRVFALFFLFAGCESMSFPLAIRRKNTRVIVYSELVAATISSSFTVLYCYYSRDFWGMVYGALLNRLLLTTFSYLFYRDVRPRLRLQREAARELLRFARYAMPSSFLTLAAAQFDKVVFLRLFDLRLLGLYGLAGSIAGPIEELITKICQLVLYPRCAHDFRADTVSYPRRYYTHNVTLFAVILGLPAAVGGAAQLLIGVLYQPRYAQAGVILQAFMVRAVLLALMMSANEMLIAAGQLQVYLVGAILRVVWLVAASLLGYRLGGFMGFVYGVALSSLLPLLYALWQQGKLRLLIMRYELYKVAFVLLAATLAYLASILLMPLLPLLPLHSRR
jgi:lipopolysaccharide exporter